MNTKQVIVMRKDLNMRKGKMIAQGAHASMAFLSHALRIGDFPNSNPGEEGRINLATGTLSEPERSWLEGSFTKICVSVDSEEELLAIKDSAGTAGVACHLIQDKGLTEFGGVPTYTCLALGPDLPENLDPLTGNLRLL